MEHPEYKDQTIEQSLKALQSEDGKERSKAADALGELGEQSAIEPLIGLLHSDSEYYVRVSAAWALGQIGGEQAMDALIIALKDYAVLSTAAEALARFKIERAIRPIIEVFENDSGVGHHYGLAAMSLATFGEPAFLPLIEALEKPKGAGLVASTLGAMGDKRAIEPLMKMVRNRNIGGMERRVGVSALGQLGGSEVFEFLKQVINDPNEEDVVRSWAAEALDRIK
jgi:HEAT repeat protein